MSYTVSVRQIGAQRFAIEILDSGEVKETLILPSWASQEGSNIVRSLVADELSYLILVDETTVTLSSVLKRGLAEYSRTLVGLNDKVDWLTRVVVELSNDIAAVSYVQLGDGE